MMMRKRHVDENGLVRYVYDISSESPDILRAFADKGTRTTVAREGSHTATANIDESEIQSFITASIQHFYSSVNEGDNVDYWQNILNQEPLPDEDRHTILSKRIATTSPAPTAPAKLPEPFKEDSEFLKSRKKPDKDTSYLSNNSHCVWATGKLLDGRNLFLDGSIRFRDYDDFLDYISFKLSSDSKTVSRNDVRIVSKGKLINRNNFAKFAAKSPKLECFHIIESRSTDAASLRPEAPGFFDINLSRRQDDILRNLNAQELGKSFTIDLLEKVRLSYDHGSGYYSFIFPTSMDSATREKWHVLLNDRLRLISGASVEINDETDHDIGRRLTVKIKNVFRNDLGATLSLILDERIADITSARLASGGGVSAPHPEPSAPPLDENRFNIRHDNNLAVSLRAEPINLTRETGLFRRVTELAEAATIEPTAPPSLPITIAAGSDFTRTTARADDADDARSVDSDDDSVPSKTINTVMYKPLNTTSEWRTRNDAARGDSWRVVDGVYRGTYDSSNNSRLTSKIDEIENAMLAALVVASNLANITTGEKFNNQDQLAKTIRFIDIARKCGGTSDEKLAGSGLSAEETTKLRDFSFYFQQLCERMGILTGRESQTGVDGSTANSFRTVGLRLTYFPVGLLDNLKSVNLNDVVSASWHRENPRVGNIKSLITDSAKISDILDSNTTKCTAALNSVGSRTGR